MTTGNPSFSKRFLNRFRLTLEFWHWRGHRV